AVAFDVDLAQLDQFGAGLGAGRRQVVGLEPGALGPAQGIAHGLGVTVGEPVVVAGGDRLESIGDRVDRPAGRTARDEHRGAGRYEQRGRGARTHSHSRQPSSSTNTASTISEGLNGVDSLSSAIAVSPSKGTETISSMTIGSSSGSSDASGAKNGRSAAQLSSRASATSPSLSAAM